MKCFELTMYLSSGRKKRKSSPWRVILLLALIGLALYVYSQIDQEQVESTFVPTPTPTRTPKSYIFEAEDRYWQGDLSGAIAAYAQALSLDTTDVEVYIALARLLALEKRTVEAVRYAERAVEMAPENARAWSILGMAYDWVGDVEEAIETCHHAVELDPAYAEGYAYLAEAYIDAGRWNEANQYAQTALELDDHSVDVHRNYGYVLEVQGNYWEAIEAYERALEIHPQLAYIHIAIGRNHRALGDLEAAAESFQKAVESDPSSAEAFDRLGWLYYNLEKHEEAEAYFQHAIEADPEYAPPYGHLAIIYWSHRNYEDAIPNFEKAIDLECIAERRRARSFFITIEQRQSQPTTPSTEVVLRGKFTPSLHHGTESMRTSLHPEKDEEAWKGTRGTVNLDTQTGTYTVTLEKMPQLRYDQTYVGWFQGVDALSGDPLNTGPLQVATDGSAEIQLEAKWVEGPQIGHLYTLGLAYFYMAECDKSYPLFDAALQIDPNELNAKEGIRLCQMAEAED